ncbi:TRAP transporter substrate-binding protein DctP [Desulfococcus sp.]|uniref:TRAP transporter substrate-binding protein n=1 Tax=Desulfococcus sp. TaxID=2025834 RepID=UPI003593CC94
MKIHRMVLPILALWVALAALPAHAARLKIATLSPDGSPWMERMRQGAAEVEEKTGGRVQIKYYPGGVMGNDTAVLQKMRIGQLQGGTLMAGSLTGFYPDIEIYSLPMKFRSLDEVDHIRKKMDPFLLASLEKKGVTAFGIAEGGFAYILSKHPVRNLADLRQRKMWIPDDDPNILEGVKAFDLKPIPLAISDVLAGLQTGLIDTVTTSPIGAVALQWHTQVKHLMNVPFMYINALLVADQKAFSRLSAEDQPVVREVLSRMFADIDRQNREDNIKAMEALRNQGINFIAPTGEALAELRERSEKVPLRLVESGRISEAIVRSLEDGLDAYRKQ